MKVGVIGHLKFPIGKPFAGGLEAFTYNFVANLCSRGHQVVLFASAESDAVLPLQPITSGGTVSTSKKRFGRANHDWIEQVEDRAYQSLMDSLQHSDLTLVHNHSLSPVPLRLADRLPCPMVTTIHCPPLDRMVDQLSATAPHPGSRFVNISKSNAQAWNDWLGPQEIIYNGVDTDVWHDSVAEKQHRAVWVGRIVPDKGTHHAVDAARLAGIPIDVVGPISDHDYFFTEVQPRMTPQDRYLGHLSHEQLCRTISRSKVAIVTPCWEEPFGLVVAEALACGTPVAAFASGALPEIIRPSVGRLARTGDTQGLAHAIDQCESLAGEVCRRFAQERFGFVRMMDEYETLYQTLLDPRSSKQVALDGP